MFAEKLTPEAPRDLAKKLAAAHGFALSGVASLSPENAAPGRAAFERWLAAGHHGPLGYMERSRQTRSDPGTRFSWARSILALGAFYAPAPSAVSSDPPLALHIAGYAQGRDYHLVFERRLKRLSRALLDAQLCTRTHWYADTGPVLERAWAAQAGLGWIGKNTCLIHPRLGSFFLLAEILLDAALAPDEPEKPHCGACTRCLQACPTGALVAPGVLDARRCLGTWNIERDGRTPQELWNAQGRWAAGCDLCQQVCPFNAPKRRAAPDAELAAPLPWHALSLRDCILLAEERFKQLFAGSPLRRTGWKGLRLGAIAAAGNLRLESCRAALEECTRDPDPEIRARARHYR